MNEHFLCHFMGPILTLFRIFLTVAAFSLLLLQFLLGQTQVFGFVGIAAGCQAQFRAALDMMVDLL